MSPTIRSGDPVLVDIGVVSVESDAIYFFQMRGQLHIKRIQRDLDGLTIISDNDKYQSIRVPADREEDLTIMAQVIYWWRWPKLLMAQAASRFPSSIKATP